MFNLTIFNRKRISPLASHVQKKPMDWFLFKKKEEPASEKTVNCELLNDAALREAASDPAIIKLIEYAKEKKA